MQFKQRYYLAKLKTILNNLGEKYILGNKYSGNTLN